MTRSLFAAAKAALCLSVFSAGAIASTPHLDYVEDQLRNLAPGSEGSVWERTTGNDIAGYQGADWLLQSPNCWGEIDCQQAPGAQQLADAIYQDLANAQEWIDITTLVTYPDGIFQEAIVAGIKQARRNNPDITIRILGGTPPGLGNFSSAITESAHNYMDRLTKDLGSAANDARLIVAGVETSWLYSWNHSKMVTVDGRSAIVGGHNLWQAAYAGVENPVSDVTMRLTGPAASSAHKFADLLWDFACTWSNNWWNQTLYVDLIKGDGFSWWSSCPATHSVSSKQASGSAQVLALGGLGFGMDAPGGDQGGLAPAHDRDAACSNLFTDYYNNDTAYSVENPEEAGLRALIESASEKVFISQQDLIAPCVAPIANAYYDARLFDILADKLIAQIPVQIVTSTPGANQGTFAPYANAKKMSEVTDILIRKVKQRGSFSESQAKDVICNNLQLAPIRIAQGVDTWAGGQQIANHAKVISVDNAAFYIGSKNLYPATLQDFGYIVEDAGAAQTFNAQYESVIWYHSKSAAVVDFETGICNL
ncbi:MAG: hypothetical protein MI867_26100 [Pseudomonadales bacterium]|nr:hypothetical protein [Pseudomonadales bacterium]